MAIAMTKSWLLLLLLTLLVVATVTGGVLGEEVPPPDVDAVTADLLGEEGVQPVTTSEMGDAILAALDASL